MKFMGRAARMQRHHKRHKGAASINLVSMIDMLTVLVFFLLVYATEQVEVLPSTKDVQLPESIAEAQVHHAVAVIVTERDVLINGKSVGTIEEILASEGVIFRRSRQSSRREPTTRCDSLGSPRSSRSPRARSRSWPTRRSLIGC